MAEPLIPLSKVIIPPLRSSVIDRPRIMDTLASATHERLLLVVAPAGFGKTTLLTQLAERRTAADQDVAWVSLTPMDNDPAIFWVHLLRALAEAGVAEDQQRSRDHLAERGADTEVIPLIISGLDSVTTPVTIVVDDYHLIQNEGIHAAVEELISLLPPQVQLAIGSRIDPPISAARLRVGGDLREIRATDLEFAHEEASDFFESLQLELSDQQVKTLSEAAEGWIAGLYIAGLSLERVEDKATFIDEFSGSQRHLLDYLTSEVLEQQSAAIRTFLLETSIVDEQNPDLCNAITGRTDSAALLRQLEAENQFVQALDEHRRSFRYHRVFADMLKETLLQDDQTDVGRLYERAAQWCLAEGHIPGAIHHLIQGESYQDAATLIIDHWIDFSNQGTHFTAFTFLEQLPDEVMSDNVELIARAAWATLNLRDYDACRHWLAMLSNAEDGVALRFASPVQAHLARHHGQTSEMRRLGELASASQIEDDLEIAAAVRATLAMGYFWTGDRQRSAIEFERAVVEGTAAQEISSIVIGDSYLAYIEARTGNHAQALVHIDRVKLHTNTTTLDRFHLAAMAHIASAEVALATGRYEQAELALAHAAQLSEIGHEPLYEVVGLATSARLAHRRGESSEARTLLADARRLLAEQPDPGWTTDAVSEASRELRFAPRPTESIDDLPLQPVTPRERAVLRLLPTDLTRAEIASELHVSLSTVKSHLHSLARKFAVSSRSDIVARAQEAGQL